jgi:WD40 repeat protein
MSTAPANRDELHRLLSALTDGTLEFADEQRLTELLAADPAARAKYYDHVLLAALLRREGRRAGAQQEGNTAKRGDSVQPSPTRASKRSAPQQARRWLMALAASILLALLLSVSEATGVTTFVPTIIRIMTGEGSLVIEVDDPGVSVALDGEDITISGAGIHELRLRPGTHRFVATKDGQPAHTEVVTIHKGKRKVVTVRSEPNPAPPDAPRAEVQLSPLIGHTGPVWSVAFTANGQRIVSASHDGTARVWDLATGKEVSQFAGHKQCVYRAAISPDGKWVLSGGGSPGKGQPNAGNWSLCLWELESGQELQRITGEADGITSILFSSDGKRALVGSYNGKVLHWDVAAWREIKQLTASPLLWHADWSADESRIVTASGFDIAAASEYRGGLHHWDLTSGDEVCRLDGHAKGVWQAVFAPSGEQVASVGTDRTVALWNARTGALEHRIPMPDVATSVAYSRDGRYLLTGNYGTGPAVRLWNLSTRKEVAAFSGHANGVQCVAISKDGRWAASGSHDRTIRIWKLPAEVHENQSARREKIGR